jgi:hypothetical protein
MRYKTLFRVMLKFLGVWLTSNAVVGMVGTITNVVTYTVIRPSSGYPYWLGFGRDAAGIGIGLYLFFGGKRIADLAIPGNRPYCHECGYDLTGAAGDVCNECGTPLRAPSPPPPLLQQQSPHPQSRGDVTA